MFSREPRKPIPSVRLPLGPRPGIEALKRRGSDVAGRGPHHDSAEGGRFGGLYCQLVPPRQDSRVPPGRTPASVDSSPQSTLVAPRPLTCPRWAGSGDELNGRLWGLCRRVRKWGQI
ncbi:hypothetical protein E5288_WYG018845 [Bos mutus]|uniref:Uncharacterized protein n=1 Tax=Bos mutus TaxID=72004 RepID=A0A6B0R6X6_9CETA|nr:hypothetical protein [Bos mutus]